MLVDNANWLVATSTLDWPVTSRHGRLELTIHESSRSLRSRFGVRCRVLVLCCSELRGPRSPSTRVRVAEDACEGEFDNGCDASHEVDAADGGVGDQCERVIGTDLTDHGRGAVRGGGDQ